MLTFHKKSLGLTGVKAVCMLFIGMCRREGNWLVVVVLAQRLFQPRPDVCHILYVYHSSPVTRMPVGYYLACNLHLVVNLQWHQPFQLSHRLV